MSWPCKLIVLTDVERELHGMPTVPNVGDMWLTPMTPHREPQVGSNYLKDWKGKRDLICVYMPGGWIWMPDLMAYSGELGRHGNGWKVHGEPPCITCEPSINACGIYHGYIRDGVITEDVEGRRFSADGKVQI